MSALSAVEAEAGTDVVSQKVIHILLEHLQAHPSRPILANQGWQRFLQRNVFPKKEHIAMAEARALAANNAAYRNAVAETLSRANFSWSKTTSSPAPTATFTAATTAKDSPCAPSQLPPHEANLPQDGETLTLTHFRSQSEDISESTPSWLLSQDAASPAQWPGNALFSFSHFYLLQGLLAESVVPRPTAALRCPELSKATRIRAPSVS